MTLSSFRFFLVLLAHPCWSFSLPPTSQPYTARVVEFTPDQSIGSANITHNLLAYDNLTAQANRKGVQIIIFPEDAINGYWHSCIRLLIVRIAYDMLPQGGKGSASMYNPDCRREFVAVKRLFLYRYKGFTSAIIANHKL